MIPLSLMRWQLACGMIQQLSNRICTSSWAPWGTLPEGSPSYTARTSYTVRGHNAEWPPCESCVAYL